MCWLFFGSRAMTIKKIANITPLGTISNAFKKRKASQKKSAYLDNNLEINIEKVLDTVASRYKISKNPDDYLYVPLLANHADRPNSNMDGWELNELQRFDDRFANFVYRTYNYKPHFVEHRADDPALSRGVILDSTLNLSNDADDETKEFVYRHTGKYIEKDAFVELLLAVDKTKDPRLAALYDDNKVAYSMGCDIESSICSACGNEARTERQFCNHIKNKFAKIPVRLEDGSQRVPFELCRGTIFQEISTVADPADPKALQQDLLLKVAHSTNLISTDFSDEDVEEIARFVIKNAKSIPDSLAGVLNALLTKTKN